MSKQQSSCLKHIADKITSRPGLILTGAKNGSRSNIDSENKGFRELGIVTDVIKASHWVLDYRPPLRPIPAVYVVVMQNGILGPGFRFEHFGGHAVRRSETPEPEHILFLRCRRESTSHLGASWRVPFRMYIKPIVCISDIWIVAGTSITGLNSSGF
jgi:hypothetical protein